MVKAKKSIKKKASKKPATAPETPTTKETQELKSSPDKGPETAPPAPTKKPVTEKKVAPPAPTKKPVTEKKVEPPQKEPEITLDTLSVEAIDGIGPKIANKLAKIGILSLTEFEKVDPVEIYEKVKIPVHRVMEYHKKAQMILEMELDDAIISALAAKNYTIEQTIEENPTKLMEITKSSKKTIMDFLKKVVRITMFLDANTCRTNSIDILHRLKSPTELEPSLKTATGTNLDTLSVLAIDGIGPKIADRMDAVGIHTIHDLMRANPAAMYSKVKVPLHRMMEYRKKAQMILGLEFEPEVIDVLAEKGYSIESAIEEDDRTIRDLTAKDKDEILNFIEKLVQITMFLDVDTCRNYSIAILHKSTEISLPPTTPTPVPPPSSPLEDDYFEFLGKEQLLAYLYSGERESIILKLLRDRARNKNEISMFLEKKGLPCTPRELNDIIDFFVRAEVAQLEWFAGNYDVHVFMISDFDIFRSPAPKIIAEAKNNLPSPLVAETYLDDVTDYFAKYIPTHEDKMKLAKALLDPDIFVTLTILREKSYPLEKFPKGFGQDRVDMQSIIRRMEEVGIVKIFQDETKKEWVMLYADVSVPQFYPEYMIENIRADVYNNKIKQDLALKHLDLLEIHYDTFFEIYNKFFQWD
ncbi:MAG: helix-hairpin-helix domain-containing protein [Candidatus Helarchaeota archaeon]